MDFKSKVYREANHVISQNVLGPIFEAISSIVPDISKNTISALRDRLMSKIIERGWSRKAGLSHKSKITISGYKDGIGLCVQTGNVSRIYADLLKLQTLWASSKITAGIIIVPLKSNAVIFGSNLASFERLNTELEIFSRVITMPLYVIGLDGLGGNNDA